MSQTMKAKHAERPGDRNFPGRTGKKDIKTGSPGLFSIARKFKNNRANVPNFRDIFY